MKLINLLNLSICLVIIFTEIAISKKYTEDISLIIKSNKSNYLEGEPIWIEHLFKANKNLKLQYQPRIDPRCDLKFIITNSRNDTSKYLGGIACGGATKYSDDTIWNSNNLLSYYGLPERFPDSKFLGQYYLPADRYSIQAILSVQFKSRTRMIKSAKINILISSPAGEDSLAYDQWREIRNSSKFDKVYTNLENKVNNFTELFPNSVYIDKVRYLLRSYSFLVLNQDEYVKKLSLEEIGRNPNNYYNYSYLTTLQYVYKNNNEFEVLLNEYKNKYKNTLLERIIKYQFTDKY